MRRSGLPLTDLLGQKISSTLDALVAQADYIYLGGRSVAVLNGSTPYYLHTDRLGTPQLATDSNESVAWLASYDSFGQALECPANSVPVEVRQTGMEGALNGTRKAA